MKGTVVLAGAGGDEVGSAHVDADDLSIRRGLDCYHLVIAQGEPPIILTLVELHAAIDDFAC